MSASKKKFLTVVKLVVIGVIICLFGAIAVPKFIEIRNADMANRCVSNLRDIDSVKYQWALENHAKSNDIVTMNDIAIYFSKGFPKCPAGGIYTIGKIGELPTCSLGTNVIPAHVLP